MTTGESHALRSVDSERADAIPTRPDLLTNAFLQRILAAARTTQDAGATTDAVADVPELQVTGFEWKPLEVGVISEVVAVTAFVRASAQGSATVEKHLVAKFLRPEFPFESMFQVESTFYSRFSNDSSVLPFDIPTPIFTSNVLTVLERVPRVKTFTCLDGCPADRISVLVTKLAQMHVRLWSYDCDGLAVPAGIGSNLSGAAKREKFPDLWRTYLDDIPLEESDRARLAALCEFLSAHPELLEATHDMVERGPQTLIHGDYHVANILFPAAAATTGAEDDRIWLLDWATCGKGNAMRDLAFFFIVSVTHTDRRVHEAQSLALYHDTVQTERVRSSAPVAPALALADWTRAYQICVLNQFLILAVYDHLSKSLAANAKTPKLRTELDAHFRAVNLRACLAVLDNVGDTTQLRELLQSA